MSVIHDALKTAQRERQAREGGMGGHTPILVPLRGARPAQSFSWKNTLTIATSIVVIVGASWTLWVRMRNLTATPSRTVPVAVIPIDSGVGTASRTPGQSGARTSVAPDRRAVAPIPDSGSQAPRRVAVAPRRVMAGGATTPPRASADVAVAAAAAAAPVPMRDPVQAGRLRIAVEQPREGDAARLFAMGVAAHRTGDLAAARSAYERVLALQPNDVDALNNMGVLLARTGELERAEESLRRAVRLAPRNAAAWNNLGTVLAQRSKANDAIASFEHALAIDPQHQGARVSLAQQQMAIGAPAKAREALEAVLASNPAMPEAHYALGQAFEMEQNWAGAVRAYSAFVRVAPPRLADDVDRVNQRIQMLSLRVK